MLREAKRISEIMDLYCECVLRKEASGTVNLEDGFENECFNSRCKQIVHFGFLCSVIRLFSYLFNCL